MGTCGNTADASWMRFAVELALKARSQGNLPIAAVLAIDDRLVAFAENETRQPRIHTGRHAEVLALASVPDKLVHRLPDMTCYTTLEPCLMCFGSLVLHRVGRVVFGSHDPLGGALDMIEHLPPYVARQARAIEWIGPIARDSCDPLWEEVASLHEYEQTDLRTR